MTLKLIQTEPTEEPVLLPALKSHLVVEHELDNVRIAALGKAARQWVEARTNRVLVRQKWRQYWDFFQVFKLEPASVKEIDQIQYTDSTGATITWATTEYTFDEPRQEVYLAFGMVHPVTRSVRNAVWLDVWSGYYNNAVSPLDVRDGVPEDIKTVIKMLVEDLYNNPGKHSEIQLYNNATFDAMLQPFVVYANG